MLGKEGVYALLCDSTNVERRGLHPVGVRRCPRVLTATFKGCKNRIIVTTFASNMHRIQAVFNIAPPPRPQGRRHGPQHGEHPEGRHGAGLPPSPRRTRLVDLNADQDRCPKDKLVIVSTGSQGEDMSALYRMAFSSHRQVEIQPGDHGHHLRLGHSGQREVHLRASSTSCTARERRSSTTSLRACTSPDTPARRS